MIRIDASSFVPPYEQIRAQIAASAAEGTLAAGTRLPTVRRLAGDLGVAPNTVARAYRELEAAGVVETRGRGGTVVTAGGDQARVRLQAAARHYAALVHELAVGTDEAVAVARAAVEALPGRTPPG